MTQTLHAIKQGEYGQPIAASVGTYPYDAWTAFFERSYEGRSFRDYAEQDRIPSAERRGYRVVKVELREAGDQSHV